VYASFAGRRSRQQSAAANAHRCRIAGHHQQQQQQKRRDARLIEMMESPLVGIGATGMPD